MTDERPAKRQRSCEATTPPATAHDPEGSAMLERASNVLAVQATALSHVTRLYQTDPDTRASLLFAVDTIVKSQRAGGKVIVCGVGKSGLVGNKFVATMKSLGIGASFMHASEATHGDLGDIRQNDVILFVSFSGKTAELLNVLPHLSADRPVLAMTSHLKPDTCPLLQPFEQGILLPTPIYEPEETSFGVCAPTTSTTVAIAIGDMLALTVAEKLHEGRTKEVFKKNHPGGAIGAVAKAVGEKVESMVTPLQLPSPTVSAVNG